MFITLLRNVGTDNPKKFILRTACSYSVSRLLGAFKYWKMHGCNIHTLQYPEEHDALFMTPWDSICNTHQIVSTSLFVNSQVKGNPRNIPSSGGFSARTVSSRSRIEYL